MATRPSTFTTSKNPFDDTPPLPKVAAPKLTLSKVAKVATIIYIVAVFILAVGLSIGMGFSLVSSPIGWLITPLAVAALLGLGTLLIYLRRELNETKTQMNPKNSETSNPSHPNDGAGWPEATEAAHIPKAFSVYRPTESIQ